MTQAFLNYYCCPDKFAPFESASSANSNPGYFRFGAATKCFGRALAATSDRPEESLPDLSREVEFDGTRYSLPFDPDEVATNLRYERYVSASKSGGGKSLVRKLYYAARPALPVAVRRHLQKLWLRGWQERPFPRWPVDRSVDQMFESLMRLSIKSSPRKRIPFVWFWPEGKSACATMTHDVETEAGLRFCNELMDINDSFNIKSSFQLIPAARYEVGQAELASIQSRGFEVNVHDLKHDGYLFSSHAKFMESAPQINRAGATFGSRGFRSAILYRNQEWFEALDFSYDMSVPNVAHLDPQRGGCCTVMPYFIGKVLEIPVTATQDYTLFHVLEDYSLDLWKQQTTLILQQHGLMSFIVHPDYLDTEKARNIYAGLLDHLAKLRAKENVWIALPAEIDRWWRQRDSMRMISEGDKWRIEGEGCERATLAYAVLKDDELAYELES
jgi:hypothetical protein